MLLQGPVVLHATVILVVCLRMTFLQAQTTTLTSNVASRPANTRPLSNSSYAWTSWGKWSPCSRSCGGGVAVQERHCLPRDPTKWHRSRKRRKLGTNNLKNHRSTREVRSSSLDCIGLNRRYHECNTKPCPGPPTDPRAEQCAAYDRRPFRGRFYTWAPYVDGDAPCTLNCRPRGQHFYASLALVADGTPCTRPGFRAICVQGACQVIGRESVLASAATRELRCGRRLVSGLFTRPRLPIGYSYIATVPRGACRLNVSEMMPSQNYIALKLINGSYIMNGEFAVSTPGNYEAGGARFLYSRNNHQDIVYSHGPLQEPVEIMILYTEPNPSIKYEYLTDSVPDETSNDIPTNKPMHTQHHQSRHHHRHHNAEPHTKSLNYPRSEPSLSKNPEITNYNSLDTSSQIESNSVGNRKFFWKIITYSQCSRSCGGGLQIGKYRCVENDGRDEREVSTAHCTGTMPPHRRRRCGLVPCPPRWRAAAWGPCPVCGPAHHTRIVGCVQDHSKGITKVSDQKCPLPMPPTSEVCDVPDCDRSVSKTEMAKPDTRRQAHSRDRVDNFRDSPAVYRVAANNSENEISNPGFEQNAFTFSAVGGWLYTEWSECVGGCFSGGIQSRGVKCTDPSGCSSRAPETSQGCSPRQFCDRDDGQWFTSEWSACSAPCNGLKVRGVICIGGKGRRLKDPSCKDPRPAVQQQCGGSCSPSWYLSDWGECQGPCESGMQTRTVWCARGGEEGASGAARDTDCPGSRPVAKRFCVPARCSTKNIVRPKPVPPTVSVPDSSQRGPRIQSRNTKNGECVDKLTNCGLAVQARLCHYHYYAEYCCSSCKGR